jgi:type I restriction enzyme, S subunit
MKQYPAYPTYKDSGVEWIGDIPQEWKVSKVKYLSNCAPEYGINTSSEAYVDQGVRFLRTTDIDDNGVLSQDGVYINPNDIDFSYLLNEYDFLISRSGTVGRAYVHNTKDKNFTYAGYLVRFRFSEPDLSRYIYWFTKAQHFLEWIDLNRIESTISNVNGQKYANLPVSLPAEQADIGLICDFLDRKTAQIDELIDKKQRQIALLEEQRTALINQAVTKGLDPDVPMKDSGIEWLGEIPAHWELVRVKHVCSVIDGDRSGEYPNEKDFVDSGIPFLSSKNIIDNVLNLDNVRFITEEKYNCLGRGKLQEEDIVITVRGTIGSTGFFYNQPYKTGFINAQMMILRPQKKIASHFLYSITRSHYWYHQVDVASYGAAQKQLSNAIIQNLFVFLPSKQEQLSILKFLQTQLSTTDHTLARIKKQIQLLQEYRTGLISAAVTGKIDVRETQE